MFLYINIKSKVRHFSDQSVSGGGCGGVQSLLDPLQSTNKELKLPPKPPEINVRYTVDLK